MESFSKKKIVKTSNFVEVMRKWDGEVLVLGNFNLLSVATHISMFCREVYSLITPT